MFLTFYKNHYKKIINILLMIATFYFILLGSELLLKIAAPIFIGLIIYSITEPFALFLNRKGLKKVIATTLSFTLFVIVILGIFTTIGAIFFTQMQQLSQSIPKYSASFENFIVYQTDFIQGNIDNIPAEALEKTKEYTTTAIAKISTLLSGFLLGLLATLSSSITIIANLTLGFFFAFFLSLDIKIWKKFYNTYAPQGVKTSFSFLKENVLKGISGYLKAQLKLIGVTFIVVLIVLLILRVENALTIAILAGIFDVLPLLGVSTLFIPWIIYLFITENIFLAVWLIALLVVVLGTRQVLEPKIIGDSLGVSASVMLAALIISINILGFVGLLISPIIIILIKALAEQGYLKAWLDLKPVEKDVHTTK